MRDARMNFRPPLTLRKRVPEIQIPDQLLEILQARRGLGVSDPRDMIYGHLGVLNIIDPNRSKLMKMIRVDYNQPVAELYRQVTRYIISAGKGLRILSHVEEVPLGSRGDLPSWVPNWNLSYVPVLHGAFREDWDKRHKSSYIDDICVSFDSTPVLGCTGSLFSPIRILLHSRPPTVDLKTLTLGLEGEHFQFSSKNDLLEGCFDICDEAYGILVDHLRHWFTSLQYDPPNMLPSKGDMMSNLLYDTRQYLTEEMCRCLLDSKNKSSLEPEFNKFLCRNSLGPAVYLLLGMIATDGSLASSFYPKIALLEDHLWSSSQSMPRSVMVYIISVQVKFRMY
jgi:hypothetical protein